VTLPSLPAGAVPCLHLLLLSLLLLLLLSWMLQLEPHTSGTQPKTCCKVSQACQLFSYIICSRYAALAPGMYVHRAYVGGWCE
jgi:hypothetical protein